MPNVDDLRQSSFITKSDVKSPILVTISGYEEVNVAMEGMKPDIKWGLHFEEIDKPFPLNVTNGVLIREITGSDKDAEDEFAEWIGKKIVLYYDPNVMFGTQRKGGIRIRAPRNQTATIPQPEITNPDFVGYDPPPPEEDEIGF